MSAQIERTGNSEDVLLFWKYASTEPAPAKYEEVPLRSCCRPTCSAN